MTFFPHAQWVGDGTQIPVVVNNETFVFNFEMNVDAYSGGLVGGHISFAEDSASVIATFEDSIVSTGERPISLLLDNKPCNHTVEVKEALEETLLVPSTPGRGQSKAPVEGAFGALKPTLEGIELRGTTSQEMALSFLQALVITYMRTLNHRKRRSKRGKSRAQLLEEQPTIEDIKRAREHFEELKKKQEKALKTLAARQNPVIRQLIQEAYTRLGLSDPTGNILTATARYPTSAVADGIGIYEGKAQSKTLPETADARYLLGIVRNLSNEREGVAIGEALWAARQRAGDLLAHKLEQERQEILDQKDTPLRQAKAFVDRSIATDSKNRLFYWLQHAGGLIRESQTPGAFYISLVRRIMATYKIPKRHREFAVRYLCEQALPIS